MKPLKLHEIARHGVEYAIELRRRGELDLGAMWATLRGAEKYLRAVARGDVAPEADQRARAIKCAGCPHQKRVRKDNGDLAIHCGICLCLVAWRRAGHQTIMPAGKTIVASERCPHKNAYWPSVERDSASES